MPPDYDALKEIFREKTYILTAHASDRAIQRDISTADMEAAISSGEVIEDYPDDKYGPSCLILGLVQDERIIHIQVSYPPNVKVITVYEPDLNEWESDWKTRKSNE